MLRLREEGGCLNTKSSEKEFHCKIPAQRHRQAIDTAEVLGDTVFTEFPFVDGAQPMAADDVTELYLNKTWRPTLVITGIWVLFLMGCCVMLW